MKSPNFYKTIKYSTALITVFIWIGFVSSISFMESWLKFQAPNVSLPIGLSIGRLIFAALNKVEWAFAILLTTLILLDKRKPNLTQPIFFCIPLVILIVQTFFLLPILDERAERILQGMSVSQSLSHFYFIFLEITKVAFLFILGINMIRRLVDNGLTIKKDSNR